MKKYTQYYTDKQLYKEGSKIPLSPQQKTRNESFGFFYFFQLEKFTFKSEEEIKKRIKIYFCLVFFVGLPLWDHGIIPLSPKKTTH
ncbi:hypothetical protein SHINM13_14250 [Flavobacterium ammonificans]|nr:hypothetical protein SHINM13_14250 [Flavobacterium ammonificans]